MLKSTLAVFLLILSSVAVNAETPFIEVISHNQTQMLGFGQKSVISWNAIGVSRVTIQYASNFNTSESANTWTTIASGVDATLKSYNWTTPSQSTLSACRIRVVSSDDSRIYDINDMDFYVMDLPEQKVKIM